jgi:hypothetical protein
MKSRMTISMTVLLLFSCGVSYAELSELEKKYLSVFGNYTGNMGIDFVPEHTFDYGFRQTIVNSKDEDVQKAFILDRLPGEIGEILYTLKSGKIMTGKGMYEDMDEEDRKALLARFEECMTLMQKLDANKHGHFYSEYRSKLNELLSPANNDASNSKYHPKLNEPLSPANDDANNRLHPYAKPGAAE